MKLRVPCLSVRQPWVWAIFEFGKDVENRDWPTRHRGGVLIHAARSCTKDEWFEAARFIGRPGNEGLVPPLDQLQRGGIVGAVDIVDCVTASTSRWFVGRYGFVLSRPRKLPFTPCLGQRGFFECPSDVLANLRAGGAP